MRTGPDGPTRSLEPSIDPSQPGPALVGPSARPSLAAPCRTGGSRARADHGPLHAGVTYSRDGGIRVRCPAAEAVSTGHNAAAGSDPSHGRPVLVNLLSAIAALTGPVTGRSGDGHGRVLAAGPPLRPSKTDFRVHSVPGRFTAPGLSAAGGS